MTGYHYRTRLGVHFLLTPYSPCSYQGTPPRHRYCDSSTTQMRKPTIRADNERCKPLLAETASQSPRPHQPQASTPAWPSSANDVCSSCASTTMLPSTTNLILLISLVTWTASLVEDENRVASDMLSAIRPLLELFMGTNDAPVATASHRQAVWI